MKKAFIAMPMANIDEQEVVRLMAVYVAKAKELGFEPMDSMVAGDNLRRRDYAAESLHMLLREADVLLLAKGWETAQGCVVEYYVAGVYGIPIIYL